MNRNLQGAVVGTALALAISFAPLALAAELAAEVGGDAAAPGEFELDTEWPFVDELTVINCTESGRGPGTIVIVPADGTWYIEVDTFFGETLTARRVILVLEGETWRAYHNGQLIRSGVGIADCGTTTTTVAPTTTTTEAPPPTLPPPACPDEDCPTPPTTTTVPPPSTTTTTFVPNQPDQNGNDSDGFAASEGG